MPRRKLAGQAVEPGDKYRELAVNRLQGRLTASPAVAGRSLFLRTDTHLYRIEERAAGAIDDAAGQ